LNNFAIDFGQLGAPMLFVTLGLAQPYEVLRWETPPSSVSVRFGSDSTGLNSGAILSRQPTEKTKI
jgi:hypothetical protein